MSVFNFPAYFMIPLFCFLEITLLIRCLISFFGVPFLIIVTISCRVDYTNITNLFIKDFIKIWCLIKLSLQNHQPNDHRINNSTCLDFDAHLPAGKDDNLMTVTLQSISLPVIQILKPHISRNLHQRPDGLAQGLGWERLKRLENFFEASGLDPHFKLLFRVERVVTFPLPHRSVRAAVGIEIRRAHLQVEQFNHKPRFLKPPYDPGRSDFPSPVLTSALSPFISANLPPQPKTAMLAHFTPWCRGVTIAPSSRCEPRNTSSLVLVACTST